jgi:CRISPR-associated protein Cmr3
VRLSIALKLTERGILIRKDELSGLFSSYGTYKGGRGSDKEGILSGWNGDGIKVNRASGSRLSLSHDASSIVGAIQPGNLRKLMGDFEDEQGEWGRFLWYVAPLRPFRLPDEDTRFEVGDLLESIYRKLDRLAPTKYRFTSDAQRFYQNYHSQLEQRKLAEPRQGIRSAIAKMQGYTARIAGILHILWETAAERIPEQRIPIERMKAANQLAEFYLGQVQLIYSDGEAAQGELNPILTQILIKAKQLGEITARTAKQLIKALKKTPPQKVREYLNELAAMGYGDLEGQGNRITAICIYIEYT